MSHSATNDAIAEACIGLPPDVADGLRRFLRGRRIGNGGKPIARDGVASRLWAWLEQRRVEDARVLDWPYRQERTVTR